MVIWLLVAYTILYFAHAIWHSKRYDKMDKDRISQEVADQKKKIDSLYGRDRL